MTAQFDLVVTSDDARQIAEFRLLDAHRTQLAYHAANIKDISVSDQRGLFDLRNFLRLYVEPGKEAAAIAKIGVLIAEKLLGQDIFTPLWQPTNPRTLRIQLPSADEGILAGALARVPWEIARPTASSETLAERNLKLRVVHDMAEPATQPLQLDSDEPLRVLFVFAEARGSRPLGARQERRQLLQLFSQEIYPKRRVVAHFLTHGVTRERLADRIQQHGGYHIVHWSGHGHLNRLELAKPGGAKDHLSGKELLALFNGAGGFLPRLLFLSACHSGDILRVQDWNDFLAAAQDQEPGAREAEHKEADAKELDLATQPGFTGTAHALLQGGVPTVVAMRYAVGDEYARELAVAFYRSLLADPQPKSAAAALALARKAKAKEHEASRFAVCDHATPLLYGAEHPGLTLEPGRSPEANPRDRRLQQIAELNITNHLHFVGRTWELAGLGADFIGASRGAEVKPVAVITGLGGMGKTALLAEALELWATNFDWVLLYQAKPNALSFETTLRDIDSRLRGELDHYHDHIKKHPADAIYRDASAGFTGPERLARLTRNLLRALQDEAILLVLDNFESNLKPQAEPGAGEPRWACQDPAWDACLKLLAQELPGSPSRVLLTSRRPLAALPDAAAYAVVLGPLPASEAALYLRAQPALRGMVFGTDQAEKQLALRLFNASRLHPLLLDRLTKLAAAPGLREQLLAALETLEKAKDYAQLPELFTAIPGDSKELAYLADALAASLDQLIGTATPDARRLLWIIALANDPVELGLLKGVWSGDSHQHALLRKVKHDLDHLPQLPSEKQEKLQAVDTPELRAMLAALPPVPARPEIEPLLRHLLSIGLVNAERAGPEDENPDFTCHELVRERIRAWMAPPCPERSELSENAIRLAYAEWLEAYFDTWQHQNMTVALEAGSRALVYCVQAEAWEKLGDFASGIVTSSKDPHLLTALLPHLQTAAEAAPAGVPRWSCLGYLADALRNGGRPDLSLSHYEQAATLARVAAEDGGDGARQAWFTLGAISGNWAIALFETGRLDAARNRQLESAEARKRAGRPAINVIASELEVLRIDILQGRVEAAWPEVEARLARVRQWWEQHRTGQSVSEAPDAEMLARAFISALDIARQVDHERKDWLSALGHLDAALEIKRALQRPAEDIGATRINRATVLLRLPDRLGEARAELEACLTLFQNNPGGRAKVFSALADLLDEQGDLPQAVTLERRALALREALPDPTLRTISHNNLANYLQRLDPAGTLAEASRHRLAALLYHLVGDLGLNLQTKLGNYAIAFRRAQAADTALTVPRLAELLADAAFAPLAEWLRERSEDVEQLQAKVDQLLEQVLRLPPAKPITLTEPPMTTLEPTLTDLLAALKTAVAAGDRTRALALEQQIQQGLALAAADQAGLERELRALLAELDRPVPEIAVEEAAFARLDFTLERSASKPDGPLPEPRLGEAAFAPVDLTLERGASGPGAIYPLWFGTNRKPEGQGFGSERHDRTTLGRALVFVPTAHRFGETGSSFWQRLRRFTLNDDRLRLQQVAARERDAFFAELNAEMHSARESGEAPQALVFLHGFNVSFEEAAIRAAQLGVDLKVPGATAFFSWPSRGKVAAYPADEASIEASEPAITAFLEDFCAHCGAEKVHLIAHSMGNRGLLRALQRIAANAQAQGGVKFGQIFLAAPDVDRDLFLDLARLYPQYAERATLYASDADKAVHLSARLHDAPRAGYYAPYTVVPGVDTVAVPDFDVDLLGHSYFAQAEALLHDIYDLMRHGQAPDRRQRLVAVEQNGQRFWQLRR